MTSFNKIDNVEDELRAEAEITSAIESATKTSPDDEIAGLGASSAVLHLKSNPTPKSQYNTTIQNDEKHLIFTYFAIQGLGEVPKLILAEAGMTYECFAVVGGEDQSKALEWRKRSPNGLLPCLSGGGIPRSSPISQSGTIIRFLAKRLGMEGDAVAASRADGLYETAKDLGQSSAQDLIASANPEKDYSVAKGPFATGKRVEKMLAGMADPKDESAALNYGQVQLFHCLLGCEARRSGCVKENLGDVLDTFRIDMENRNGLKEYLSSTARFPFTRSEAGQSPGGYVYTTGPLKRGDIKYSA